MSKRLMFSMLGALVVGAGTAIAGTPAPLQAEGCNQECDENDECEDAAVYWFCDEGQTKCHEIGTTCEEP